MKFSTKAIHVGEEPDMREGSSGDVVMPIHLATTYARKEVDKPSGGYEYSRTSNPTRYALEKRYAALENARYGLGFASGLAAETTLIMSLLEKGDHVIAFDDLYGGSRRLFTNVFQNYGIEFSYVDARNPVEVEKALRNNTRLFWMETPTNPLMRLCDIKEIASIANENNITCVIDNTFMTPYFQQPLQLGAHVVVHSATKYLGGHSDVVGGAIMLSDEELYQRIKYNQNAMGAVPSPFDCYLVLRGCKTLAVRMERHQQNAQKVSEFLASHGKVKTVYYPGLPGHPQHGLAQKQMYGFGGMLSFQIDGNLENTLGFLKKVKIFALAESLGGVESLIEHPALMTHASIPVEERNQLGISDNLVRISVGIEDIDDLIEDLDKALSF